MFKRFPNFWTPVLPIAEIADVPVGIELAGEKLVLFRSPSGKIGTLLDRCPHRGAALSLGRVSEDGCLECPYHGWQFDLDGNCTQVPLNNPNNVNLSQLSAVSLPTRIAAGLVWVFTGESEHEELNLPESLMQPEQSYVIHHEVWNSHWTRIVENGMDYLHIPFVHRNSFGGKIGQPALEAKSIVEFQIQQTKQGAQVFNRFHNIPSGFSFEWFQPNLVVFKFDEMGIPLRIHQFSVPLNEHQTRYIFAMLMLGDIDPESQTSIANEFILPIVEDRLVIESQKGEIPATTEECNVPTDKATLLFRRWYHQTIQK
jgi:phenylpropionate dioxygenase-like ring-hydroxylating dioxygenase large terminal subunit